MGSNPTPSASVRGFCEVCRAYTEARRLVRAAALCRLIPLKTARTKKGLAHGLAHGSVLAKAALLRIGIELVEREAQPRQHFAQLVVGRQAFRVAAGRFGLCHWRP